MGSEGVSWLFVLLSATQGMLMFCDRFFLDFNTMRCCTDANSCASGVLSVLQLACAFAGQLAVEVMFLIVVQRRLLPLLGLGAMLLLGAIVSVLGIVFLVQRSGVGVTDLADVLAVSAMVIGIVLYGPQMLLTYRQRSAGSLSLIGLAIQTGGIIVFASFQCCDRMQVFIPQCFTFALSAALLGMCVYFEIRRRRDEVAFIEPDTSDTEAEILLTDAEMGDVLEK